MCNIYCHDCEAFEWREINRRGICILKPNPPTQFEKLQAILNRGIEYIYEKALSNFSTPHNYVEYFLEDEFNVQFTDPYDGLICIICSQTLSFCNCYEPTVKMQEIEREECYGYFMDPSLEVDNNILNTTMCEQAVNAIVVVRNTIE